ncbi:DUF937 domain-containing protein [Curtobacterium sp. NPDC090217]|uniref:DUF937 domain-containing protein n=1 Tax=Curtobacterium sp. NPDC090217 TaxID=3363970 RepID=UPI003825B213
MAGLDDIISQIPIGDLAKKLGVDEATANQAVQKALPALLGGMRANAEQGGGQSLEQAVDKHSAALVDGGVDLDDVDTDDGSKIVKNVFGSSENQVAAALGSTGGGAGGGIGDVIGKALPVLAPIVMSFLAKQKGGGAEATGGGGIGDLLGGLLGGGGGGGAAAGGAKSGGGIGDLLGGLGGLLGGGKK